MANLAHTIWTLGRALKAVPAAQAALDALEPALSGDPLARRQLLGEHLPAIAEAWREGAGNDLTHIVEGMRHLVYGPETVEGEYSVLQQEYPWDRFSRWITGLRSGTVLFLGPRGSGKSVAACRLAERWRARTGWPVLGVNVYADSRYIDLEPVPSDLFRALVERLIAILDPPVTGKRARPVPLYVPGTHPSAYKYESLSDRDLEDLLCQDWAALMDPERQASLIAPFRRKVVLLDEVPLLTGGGSLANRALVGNLVNQCRHLEWLLAIISQTTRPLRMDLLNVEAIIVKEPTGVEFLTDRHDEPLVRKIWSDAGDTFSALQHSPWRNLPGLSDIRSWAHCHCPKMGDGAEGYYGPVPFSMPGEMDGEAA